MRDRPLSISLFCCFLIACVRPHIVLAAGDFTSVFNSTYTVMADAPAQVDLKVSLTNVTADTFAQEYDLSFGSDRLKNISVISHTGKTLTPVIETANHATNIHIMFDTPVVGKGKTNTFSIHFQDPDAAQFVGQVLEITIPKLASQNNVDQYQVDLLIPQEYGPPSTISPVPTSQTVDPAFTHLRFVSPGLISSGIIAIFGERQIYDLKLQYHLANTTVTPLETQIALPPDTPFQKIYLPVINPPPLSIHRDADGNWIASYRLEPKQLVTVTVTGSAIVYMKPLVPVTAPDTDIQTYVTKQALWPITDPFVVSMSQNLHTPQAVYNYIVGHFTYDYARIDNRSTTRLGGLEALKNPHQALCLEFADAFITLSRAAGIPARLLEGYAYTENNRLRPLSLVSDILHAWPEYYDFSTSSWHPVDPTWEVTTGGLDYFHSLDFNHLVFTILGSSAERPFPVGLYKNPGENTKDVDVTLSRSLPDTTISLSPQFQLPLLTRLGLSNRATFSLVNRTAFALYQEPMAITGINLRLNNPPSSAPMLLPYQAADIPVEFIPENVYDHQSLVFTIQNHPQNFPVTRFFHLALSVSLIALTALVVTIVTFSLFITRRLLVSRSSKKRPLHR